MLVDPVGELDSNELPFASSALVFHLVEYGTHYVDVWMKSKYQYRINTPQVRASPVEGRTNED